MKKILNMVLAVSVLIAYWCMRMSYFVINDFVFNGFSWVLLALFAINAVYSIVYVMTKKKSRLVFVNFGVSMFALILDLGILIASFDAWLYYLREFWSFLPYLLITGIAFFLIFVYPKTKLHKNKIISIAMIAIIILAIINSVVSFVPFAFRTKPVVFDSGDKYAIVWTTTSNATSWIEYTDKNSGELVRVYETDGGNRRTDKKIHKIVVDKLALENNTYTAKSTRILMHLSNDVTKGKTIQTAPIDFKGYDGGDNVSFLCLADIHGYGNAAVKASSYVKDFDFVVLLGDMASQLSSEGEIIDSILKASEKITGGRIPVLAVRGNHETRGRLTSTLKDYIGLPENEYYYTFEYGPLSAVVVDTGEDKKDDHSEYSGLAEYTAYKDKQTEWLNELISSDFFNNPDIKYNIVIGHIPLHEIDEWNNIKDWLDIFNTLPILAQFAGHEHIAKIYQPDDDHNFPVIITGGRKGNLGTQFTAMQVEMSLQGIALKACNQKGEIVLNEILNY